MDETRYIGLRAAHGLCLLAGLKIASILEAIFKPAIKHNTCSAGTKSRNSDSQRVAF